MKILFLQDYIYSGISTNVRLATSIAESLAQKGHDVHYLINAEAGTLTKENAHYFTSYKDKILYDTVKFSREQGKSALQTAINIFKSPNALINLFCTLALKKSFIENEFKTEIEQLCTKENFDVVIATACPFYTVFALAKSNISAKKVAYMLDPYSTNKTMAYAVSLWREKTLYKNIDIAIITDLMLKENTTSSLNAYVDKMRVLAFPGIKKLEYDDSYADFFNDSDNINCVYIGGLYPTIRSPVYLLNLFKLLDESLSVYLIGPGKEGFPIDFFKGFEKTLKDRLQLSGQVNSEKAQQIMLNADILINIGNKTENQLPSKVLEYLSTGKPIINIYKTDKCPTLQYFKNYPFALNIKEGDYSKTTIETINTFCKEFKGKQLDFSFIEENFYFATPEYVTDEFEKILKEVI